MSHPKIQHYVPAFLLRNFHANEKNQINVFDKWKDKTFIASPNKIASENAFYDFEYEGATFTVEPALSELETKASSIIQEILGNNSLHALNDTKKETMAVFLAGPVQYLRTKQFRENLRHMRDTSKDKVNGLGFDTENLEGFPESDDDLKQMSIMFLKESEKMYPLFFDKTWMLFKTNDENPFYISDSPLTLNNEINMEPYGNLGLALKGIEIYLPLSKNLTLGLFWKEYEEQIDSGVMNIDRIEKITPGELKEVDINTEGILETYRGIHQGIPITAKPENVMRMNSLQVSFSTRFVFSSNDDFSLVKKMIQDKEDYRGGHKPEVDPGIRTGS